MTLTFDRMTLNWSKVMKGGAYQLLQLHFIVYIFVYIKEYSSTHSVDIILKNVIFDDLK